MNNGMDDEIMDKKLEEMHEKRVEDMKTVIRATNAFIDSCSTQQAKEELEDTATGMLYSRILDGGDLKGLIQAIERVYFEVEGRGYQFNKFQEVMLKAIHAITPTAKIMRNM